MIGPELGFCIDDTDYRWATLPGAVAGMPPLPSTLAYLHRHLPCRSAFGLPTLCATVSAPAPDRPVMGVSYELEEGGLTEPLRERLGPPTEQGHSDLSGYRNRSSGVAEWARWRRSSVTLHLSIYGAPRASARGRSVGLISIGWDDVAAAAQPFIAAWHAEVAALRESTAVIAGFRRFDLPAPLRPIGGAASTAAHRALFNRTLLMTPQLVKDQFELSSAAWNPRHPERSEGSPRMESPWREIPRSARNDGCRDNAFALWRSVTSGRWSLSSLWDSVVLGGRVSWNEMKPAKGGGRSELSVNGWSVIAPYGASAIAAAAAALKALPGIVVEAYEGYDD